MQRLLLSSLLVCFALVGTSAAAPRSQSLGVPWEGRLVGGVQLPAEGEHFFTWDSIRERSPNRGWRRFGNARLVSTLVAVVDEYAAANPSAPRVGVADLSRPNGGDFGRRFGGVGHSSHQNGLDVDVYYPRRDRCECRPQRPRQIDRVLAQDLLDRFVAAGAAKVFVGPHTGLTGPPAIVEVLPAYHDDHMHVRLPGDGVVPTTVGPVRAFVVGEGHTRVLVLGWTRTASAVAHRLLYTPPVAGVSMYVVPDLRGAAHVGDLLAERLQPDVTIRFEQRRKPAKPRFRRSGSFVIQLRPGRMGLGEAKPYAEAITRLYAG